MQLLFKVEKDKGLDRIKMYAQETEDGPIYSMWSGEVDEKPMTVEQVEDTVMAVKGLDTILKLEEHLRRMMPPGVYDHYKEMYKTEKAKEKEDE